LVIRTVFQVNIYELNAVLPLGFVPFYGLGLFWLVNAAYNGERSVHKFGVNGVVALERNRGPCDDDDSGPETLPG
jgi:hypothetical protein